MFRSTNIHLGQELPIETLSPLNVCLLREGGSKRPKSNNVQASHRKMKLRASDLPERTGVTSIARHLLYSVMDLVRFSGEVSTLVREDWGVRNLKIHNQYHYCTHNHNGQV